MMHLRTLHRPQLRVEPPAGLGWFLIVCYRALSKCTRWCFCLVRMDSAVVAQSLADVGLMRGSMMADLEADTQFWQVLQSVLPELPKDVKMEANLALYGLDSLNTVQLMVELEQVFAFEFDDDELTPETFATPAALWKIVSTRQFSR